jgi:uncharacterized membrane protein YfcA
LETLILLIAGGAAGGLVNGLAGFGTGIAALPFWLYVLHAREAAPLVAACSVVGQLQSLPLVHHAIDWRRALPFVIGGLVGIPIGTALLNLAPTGLIKLGVGLLIVVYCVVLLLSPSRKPLLTGGALADAAIGWMGGVLGGLIGLSGPLPTIWASLRGWAKDERRAVFQVFNLTILAVSFWAQLMAGAVDAEWLRLAAVAIPATMVGSAFGQAIYRRMSHRHFDRIILITLLLTGSFTVVQVIDELIPGG